MTPEAFIKRAVRTYLDEISAWHFAPTMNGYGRHGIPDDIGCLPVIVTQAMVGRRVGLFIAVESKTENGKTTRWQEKELNAIRAAGGIAIVARGDGAVEAMKAVLG